MSYFLFAEAIYDQRELYLYQTKETVLTTNSQVVMEPCRDFTHITDITNGTISALDKGYDLEVINLGNCYPQRVSYMIHRLEDLLGKQAIIKYRPLPIGDVPCTFADITKARKLLDFEPTVNLEEGLEDFCDWFIRWKKLKQDESLFV